LKNEGIAKISFSTIFYKYYNNKLTFPGCLAGVGDIIRQEIRQNYSNKFFPVNRSFHVVIFKNFAFKQYGTTVSEKRVKIYRKIWQNTWSTKL
jgi:hypothetical protein